VNDLNPRLKDFVSRIDDVLNGMINAATDEADLDGALRMKQAVKRAVCAIFDRGTRDDPMVASDHFDQWLMLLSRGRRRKPSVQEVYERLKEVHLQMSKVLLRVCKENRELKDTARSIARGGRA
jgi:hypothetical protein